MLIRCGFHRPPKNNFWVKIVRLFLFLVTQPALSRHSTSSGWWRLKGKGSPYSIAQRRVLELIPVLGSQPAGGVSHKPNGRLPVLSARPAVTSATLKRAATNFAAWWTEARWVWTILLPDSIATESSMLITRLPSHQWRLFHCKAINETEDCKDTNTTAHAVLLDERY